MTEKTEVQKLVPGHDVELSFGPVHVRELPFVEALRLQGAPGARAFFTELAQALKTGGDDHALVLQTAACHPDWWLAFLSAATGRAREEIGQVSPRDGMLLSIAALAENADFFGVGMGTVAAAASSTSSPSSSGTGMPTQSS